MMNRPGFGGGLTGEMPVIVCLSFCGRAVPKGAEESVVVDQGHPFQGGQFQ